MVNAGSFDVNFTPAAPFIDTGYYLVGDMFTIKNDKDETSVNGWSADGMVGFSHSGTEFMKIPNFPSYSPQPLIINAGKLFRRPIPRENSGELVYWEP